MLTSTASAWPHSQLWEMAAPFYLRLLCTVMSMSVARSPVRHLRGQFAWQPLFHCICFAQS